jgi:hypothetical protein
MWIFKLFTWLKDWYKSWYPKIIPYENLYPLGTKKENIDETIENLCHKRAEEETPNGNVIMTYDEPSNIFFYWSNNAIEYKYLEVVARKFVILYDCKDIYINMFRELLKSLNKQKDVPLREGPFVTLKSYNTISHKVSNKKLVNERSNQYKRIGKWGDVPVPLNEFKHISFLEYKKYEGSGKNV